MRTTNSDKLEYNDIPTLHGDGVQDDAPALLALFTNQPFFYQGRFYDRDAPVEFDGEGIVLCLHHLIRIEPGPDNTYAERPLTLGDNVITDAVPEELIIRGLLGARQRRITWDATVRMIPGGQLRKYVTVRLPTVSYHGHA